MPDMNLKTTVQTQKLKLKAQDKEIRRLKKALSAVLISSESDDSPEDSSLEDDSDTDLDAVESEDDSFALELPEPVCDDVYRCIKCFFEVVDGECQKCGLEHKWSQDYDHDSYATENLAIHSDRSLVPRGDTPLLDIKFWTLQAPAEYSASHYPVKSQSRLSEYKQLLMRGATALMCEKFHLEFAYEGGIYAWADADLYEEFAGPLMQVGDFWKIHLGRRITLDPKDLDGSEFIENLLEDALIFPFRSDASEREYEKWETKEETPGIWVTRLMAHDDAEFDSGDSDEESDVEDTNKANEATAKAEDDALVQDSEPLDGPIRRNEYLAMDEEWDSDTGEKTEALEDESYEGEEYSDDESYYEDENNADVVLSMGADTAYDYDSDEASNTSSVPTTEATDSEHAGEASDYDSVVEDLRSRALVGA